MSELADLIPGQVYGREDWGAPSEPGGSRRERDEVIGFTFHHTTGSTLGVEDTVQWVKNIYDFHTGQQGWADIGYAYLVDRYGNVFVGRGRFRVLAHAAGFNTDWFGCAYLGTGIEGHVTDEAKLAFIGLRDWLRSDGGMSNMDDVNGHRDLGDTSCPEGYLYRWGVELGMPRPEEVAVGTFDDVPEDSTHYEAIEWLADEGLIEGYQDGTFRPNQEITRGQMATMLYRALNR